MWDAEHEAAAKRLTMPNLAGYPYPFNETAVPTRQLLDAMKLAFWAIEERAPGRVAAPERLATIEWFREVGYPWLLRVGNAKGQGLGWFELKDGSSLPVVTYNANGYPGTVPIPEGTTAAQLTEFLKWQGIDLDEGD